MPRENTIREHTIEPASDGVGVVVWGHGEYGSTSVLAGSSLRQWFGAYVNVSAALTHYPRASVLDYSTKIEFTIPHNPPDCFDPADAGERWDEDW